MIFSTPEFFVLLGGVLLGLHCFSTEDGRRNLLLAASYFFYGWWDWRFCFLILASTLIDHEVALRMERSTTNTSRRRWLILSLTANLGFLGFFKYANFFIDSLDPVFGIHVPHVNILLPVGISFFTFQTMSYSIDVYRGKLPAIRSLRDFALFVAFFPQLVAGPIVRGSEFLPQLTSNHPLRGGNVRTGIEIFAKGFVKKLLFADTLAVYVDRVFGAPEAYDPATVWFALIAFSFQVYYDFSGYSEMAIGVARMLGFKLPVNFRHPYLSRNLPEFWQRWHISFSSWLRDYLYIRLGGNRRGVPRMYFNLLITMLLGGLWHGASWHFVIWGGFHGLGLVAHRTIQSRNGGRAPRTSQTAGILGWMVTMLYWLIGLVFFRAGSMSDVSVILGKMCFLDGSGIHWPYLQALVVIALSVVLHMATYLRDEREYRLDLSSAGGWTLVLSALLAILFWAPMNTTAFIYFQF